MYQNDWDCDFRKSFLQLSSCFNVQCTVCRVYFIIVFFFLNNWICDIPECVLIIFTNNLLLLFSLSWNIIASFLKDISLLLSGNGYRFGVCTNLNLKVLKLSCPIILFTIFYWNPYPNVIYLLGQEYHIEIHFRDQFLNTVCSAIQYSTSKYYTSY